MFLLFLTGAAWAFGQAANSLLTGIAAWVLGAGVSYGLARLFSGGSPLELGSLKSDTKRLTGRMTWFGLWLLLVGLINWGVRALSKNEALAAGLAIGGVVLVLMIVRASVKGQGLS